MRTFVMVDELAGVDSGHKDVVAYEGVVFGNGMVAISEVEHHYVTTFNEIEQLRKLIEAKKKWRIKWMD